MNKILPLLGNQDKCVQMGPEVRSTEQKLCRMRATHTECLKCRPWQLQEEAKKSAFENRIYML